MSDVNTAESSAAEVPPIESWSDAQRQTWLETGKTPEPTKSGASAASTESSGAASTAEGKTAETTAPASEAGKNTQEPKHKKTAEDRKAELAAEIQDLLKKRAELRNEVSQPKPQDGKPSESSAAKPAEKKQDAEKEPQIDDFDTLEAYYKALAKWQVDQTLAAERENQAKTAKEQKIAETNRQIEEGWKQRVGEAVKKHADYVEVAFNEKLPINPTMDGYILDSELGAEILYELGSNVEECKRIAALGPYATARELTRIEDRLAGKKQTATGNTKTTSAPPPPTDLGARNTAPGDEVEQALKDGDFAQYMKLMNQRDLAKNKG